MSAPNQSTIYIHDRMRELAFENALNVTDASGDQNSSLPPGPAIPQYMNPMSFFSIWETYTGQINAKRHSPNFVVEYARLSPDNEERQGKVFDLIQEIIDSRDEHQGR
ncbi:hypothetical protein SLS60_007325 [Paraconiothyrium brasiliense]|uniref:Uncharacterized protein n=1 Tax=Paraconiothyrium brasiliense TaxID=300254 RepID=A0ABR3R582_9PLEO